MNPSRYRLAHSNVGRVYINPFQQYVIFKLFLSLYTNGILLIIVIPFFDPDIYLYIPL